MATHPVPDGAPGWLPRPPGPGKPRFVPPAGAAGVRRAVVGPAARLPLVPAREHSPVGAGKDELSALRDH